MKFDYYRYQLKNKVRAVALPLKNSDSVTVMVLVKTGSRNEDDKQLGISHVVEHMVFKGTEKYPTPLSLATAVDSMGAEFNAFTGKEYTAFYIHSAKEYLAKSVEILADMVLKPRLREEDLSREKKVIIEEINMYEDQPREKALEEFENLIFQGSNLGRPIIGYQQTVEGVNSQDLRKYMTKWYRGANILILVVGQVKEKEVFPIVEKYFQSAPAGSLSKFVDQGRFGQENKKIIKKETEQTHFVLGFPGIDIRDERRYPLSLLKVILGGNMSSRLFVEIREKRGLAYYISAFYEAFYDTGYFAVRGGIRKDKIDQALAIVKNEVFSLAVDLKERELDRAKKYILGKLPLSLETQSGLINWLAPRFLFELPIIQPVEDEKKIRQVSLKDVKKLAEKIFQEDKLYLSLVK